ncbi:MAG: glycosyltransferase [Microcystaceae cyanobacterium]
MSQKLPIRVTTLVFFGTFVLFGAIAVGWYFDLPIIDRFFTQLHIIQNSPPTWIDIPPLEHYLLIYLPSLIFVAIIVAITKASPTPKQWSRTAIIIILIALSIRYLIWRSLSSLNLADPIVGTVSLAVFLIESLIVYSVLVQSFLDLNFKERSTEADIYSKDILTGKYQPSVDILIPTYNEPEFILRRTIIGCQAMNYHNKRIYVLDDTRRPEIRQLAQQLGCYYITRPDNRYAKAGNLNNALTQTQGELIAVFDADFVPTSNFLVRTVGFFQNQKIGLLQTCQSYFNYESIAYNLGLEEQLNGEEDFFHSYGQPIRDGLGAGFCSGSSFVVRRRTLEDVGGFDIESIAEDYYTGLKITAHNYKVIHLNEQLSAGLYTESIPANIQQKYRWGQGTIQTLFVKISFLRLPNLTIQQKLACFNSMLYWILPVFQSFLLIIPLLYVFFDINPVQVSLEEIIYFFLPYYLTHLLSFHWLNGRCRTIIMSEVYKYVRFFPMIVMVLTTFINPFGKGFKITPKGILQTKGHFYWQLGLPLVILWGINALAFAKSIATTQLLEGGILNLGLIWSAYNLIILGIALKALKERPRTEHFTWFSLYYPVQLNNHLNGITEQLSEKGAIINLSSPTQPDSLSPDQIIPLTFINQNLTIKSRIKTIETTSSGIRLTLSFSHVTLEQYRQIVKLLFCDRTQWKQKTVPGEWQTLWLFFKQLVSQ